MTTRSPGATTIPALRGTLGDWIYYATVMPLGDVAQRVTRTDQVHSNRRLRDWIQREITPRAGDIASYLKNQPQRFFNAVVVGIYGGDPEWFPVEVGEGPVAGAPGLADATRGSMGVLRLTGTERIFAIDGQHRIEGIKQAIGDERQLENEQLAVIFVAHHTDASGKQRTRRLFSTLNRYAKPVSKGEIVALDEDDAFAIVTRRLVEEYPALMGDRVAYSRTTPIPPGNASAITTILGLYDLVVTLEVSLRENRKQRLRELTALRPPRDVIDAVYRKQVELWEALVRYVRPIAQCVRADAREGVARRYRTNEGGHLLFRPAGQKVFGQAVRVLMDRNLSIQDAVAQLSRAPMMLQDQFWHGVLWDPNAQRMVTRNAKLGQNLLLFATRHASEPRDYDLREEYRRATGRDLPRRRRM